jgi:hypothetical protein
MYRSCALTIATLLFFGILAEKPAYSARIDGYSQTGGDAIASLNYQSHNFAINVIERTPACAGPRGFIEQDGVIPGLIRRVGENICPGRVWDNRVQRKAGEGNSGSVGFSFVVQDKVLGFSDNIDRSRDVINGLAFGNINIAAQNAFSGNEFEPSDVVGSPFIHGDVDGGRVAASDISSWEKIFNYMRGGEKYAALVDKEGSSVNQRDIDSARGIFFQTNNGADGLFRLVDSFNERIALSDNGSVEPSKQQTNSNENLATQSSGVVNGTVAPFIARCTIISDKGIWNVQCPEYIYPVHGSTN